MAEGLVRHIKQGELYFGRDTGVLKTLVGSCVAIVLWHQQKKLGGMCHIVLPDSGHAKAGCDNRFADCAIEAFMKKIKEEGTHPSDYWVGVYGGGNMFPSIHFANNKPIGEKNLSVVCQRLKEYGFRVVHKDIGGAVYRMLSFDLESGEVVLKTTDIAIIQSVSE
jgi:chemotaxis protein CheD